MTCGRWVFSSQWLSNYFVPLSDWLSLMDVAQILPPALMQMSVGFTLTSSSWIPFPSPPPPPLLILRTTRPRLSLTRIHEDDRGFATWRGLSSLVSSPSSLTNPQNTRPVLASELRVEATYVTSGLYEKSQRGPLQLRSPSGLLHIMLSTLCVGMT